jgi:hypothetical protein
MPKRQIGCRLSAEAIKIAEDYAAQNGISREAAIDELIRRGNQTFIDSLDRLNDLATLVAEKLTINN